MKVINFNKAELMYNVHTYIATKKESLIGDLAGYHDDPIRFMRRARLLSQLATYESSIFMKIYNFDPDELSDVSEMLNRIKFEIDAVSSIYS